ncbi:MAG: ribonucleoside triphosphate reductase [Verrucomicrobiota bacterium]|jgi:ribonucleoside-triphosphate reductase|nr:ribonucleoside triphosphate reductase [Verrucomicrobiota bacterium]
MNEWVQQDWAIRIHKRDGRIEAFEPKKIVAAIQKAGEATGEFAADEARRLTLKAVTLIHSLRDTLALTVENVQDIVEEVLLASPYRRTAKAYIIYREQHARIREMVRKADVDLIDSYLARADWRVRENSNMAYSLQGLNNYISSEVSKVYWLNKIYPAEVREAHDNGALHLHDLGLLSVYCVGWDLQDLLRSGFKGVAGKAESHPAKHFRTALGQIVNFFYTLQGEAAGAQAFSSFDTLLAPFVRHDGLGPKEVKQALQEFIFNVNVPTRVGFQTPFTNLTMDLIPPGTLANESVIIGGQPQPETYADFQPEMDMINSAFLEVLTEGDAKGRVFTFPIPTYNISKDFDWERPGLEKLWEVTAKYGIPYFANFVNSDMHPDDARSMCCRLRLDTRELSRRGGGLFGANPQTGSIGVVTVNMPRLGHLAADEDDFLRRLDGLMAIARNSLEIKRKVLEGFTAQDLYPYTKFYLRQVHQRFQCYWKNHFSTIGLVGLNEACLNLFGKDIGTEEGRAFALRVMDFMRGRLADYQEQTGHFYNLEATPAEGTTYRLAQLDKKLYPDILTAGDGGAPFYSNSTQLPVNYSDDILRVLDLQDDIQTKYTGGTVVHAFVGEAVSDPQAVKSFVRMVCQNYRLPYFTLTPTFSICEDHGYLAGEVHACPHCAKRTEVYSRVVGYIRPIQQWNEGKQHEFRQRKTYRVTQAAAQ